MAGIKFRIDVKTEEVEALMERLNETIGPRGTKRFLKTEGSRMLQRITAQRFVREGDAAVGGRWVPLSRATEAFRKRGGFPQSHPINYRTGEMFRWAVSAQGRVTEEGDGTHSLMYPGKQPTGELLSKVNTAQRGKKKRGRGTGATPARPILGLGDRDAEEFLNSLDNFIAKNGGLR
jgi:hypothetical protein